MYSAHASEECNHLLSDRTAAAIQNLAELRYHLDSQLAKGETSTITEAMSSAFSLKVEQLLESNALSGLTREVLVQKIKAEIEKLQAREAGQALGNAALEREQIKRFEEIRVSVGDLKPLSQPRNWASTCKISESKILFAGGEDAKGGYLTSLEIYDVQTGTSKVIGHLAQGREHIRLQLLADGKVLAWGGSSRQVPVDSVELIDPIMKTVTVLDVTLSNPGQAFALPNGNFLQLGRSDGFSVLNLKTHKLKNYQLVHTSISKARAVSQLPDGSIVFVGGISSERDGTVKDIVKIDGTTLKVSRSSKLPASVAWQAQIGMSNDEIILSGGEWNGQAPYSGASTRVERLDIASGKLTPIGNLGQTRNGHTMILLSGNRLLVLGGFREVPQQPNQSIDTFEIFDLNNETLEWNDTLNLGSNYSTFVTDQGVVIVKGHDSSMKLIKVGAM